VRLRRSGGKGTAGTAVGERSDGLDAP